MKLNPKHRASRRRQSTRASSFGEWIRRISNNAGSEVPHAVVIGTSAGETTKLVAGGFAVEPFPNTRSSGIPEWLQVVVEVPRQRRSRRRAP